MLNESEQRHSFQDDDRKQIARARQEAEALFQPKPQLMKSATPAEPPLAKLSARKPRILSASPTSGRPPHDVKDPNSEPIEPAVLGSQSSGIHRDRLNSARAAIFKEQRELQVKLDAIDTEMRAIDAYEAVRKKITGGPPTL